MADDVAAIRRLLDTMADAVHAKNATGVIATYAADVVSYDLAPPLVQDAAAARDAEGQNAWFATWDGPVTVTMDDPHVEVAGDLGVAWGLKHLTGRKVSGQGGAQDLWYRATIVLRRTRDGWRIVHLHESVPFAMDGSGRALLDLKPEGDGA